LEKTLRAIKTETLSTTTEAPSPTEIVNAHSEAIYKFCLKLAYCKEDAEDLFQETFLKAFEQPHKINEAASPKNFLFSTAVYLWKSKKRKYARRNRLAPVFDLDDEVVICSDSTEDVIILKEETQIVQNLVNALPEKFKIPIILHYTNEMGLTDIASSLNIPIGTVKSRLYKARKIIEKGLINLE
jgi:RNA polymerase sigma-70 factor (ECF subfamily)